MEAYIFKKEPYYGEFTWFFDVDNRNEEYDCYDHEDLLVIQAQKSDDDDEYPDTD